MPTYLYTGSSPITSAEAGNIPAGPFVFSFPTTPKVVTDNPSLFSVVFEELSTLTAVLAMRIEDRVSSDFTQRIFTTAEAASFSNEQYKQLGVWREWDGSTTIGLFFWNGTARAAVAGGGGGEANTLSTRGAGTSLAGAKSGVDLGVKSLVAGPGVALSSSATEVTVSTLTPILTESTTARTLALSDAGDLILCNNASAIAVTVPTNATVAFPIGTTIAFSQQGAGQVTIAGAGGVTVNTSSTLKTRAQHSIIGIQKVDTDTWLAFGDLATS